MNVNKYEKFNDVDECYKFLDKYGMWDLGNIEINGKDYDYGNMYWFDALEELKKLLE